MNIASYNRIADKWDSDRRKKPVDPCVEEFAAMLPAGAKVLDIGCGTGYPIDEYLSSMGFTVTGIDPAERMLEKATGLGLPNALFLHTDLFGFETEEKFDAAIAFDSIFHIPLERQRDIYPKVAGLLKDGAYFLFTHGRVTGSVQGTMYGEPFFYSALDGDILKSCLSKAGFEIVRFVENYSDPVTGTRDLVVLAQRTLNKGKPMDIILR